MAPPAAAFKRVMRILKFIVALFSIASATAGAGYYWLSTQPLQMSAERIEFRVPSGVGLRRVAQVVEQSGIGIPAWQFTLLGRALNRSEKIKAGSYEVAQGITALQLLDILTRGEVSRGEITLVEGRTFRQFRAQLDANPALTHDSTALKEAEILTRLGIAGNRLEGWFFPDTYLFDKGSSDLDVLRRAHSAMAKRLDEAWQARDPQSRLKSPYEMLILASIVEKETGSADDRGPIASVFINRLRRNMPLQTDPTVIYGMGERFDGNLRKADLQTDTAWNTYTRPGLPPTPIAMPGAGALLAVSRPPATEFVYFVARGDGSSEFSTTLEAHNRAVARFQKGGKS